MDGHVVDLLQLLVSGLEDVHEFALVSFAKHLHHIVTCAWLTQTGLQLMRCHCDWAALWHEVHFGLEVSILIQSQPLTLFTVLITWRDESLQCGLTGVDHLLGKKQVSDHLLVTGQSVQDSSG